MFQDPMPHRAYVERLLITLLIGGVALLLWNLRGLLLLVFGSVLVAVILNLVAAPIRDRLGLPRGLALLVAVLIVASLIGTAFWMFGSEVIRQSESLREMIPAAWQAMLARFDDWGIGAPVREWTEGLGSGGGIVSNVGSLALSVGNAVADILLVVVGGIYLAAQPDIYWAGLLKLLPERARTLAAQALEASGRGLRLWLLGRLISMAVVGLLTFFGLWLIGVPSALTLGLLAALLEFVPFLGPILAALPAILLAFAQEPEMALWTIALFVAIQQFEGNVLEPLIQQRAVEIPPALLLFALVAGTLLFGVSGILLAAPFTVVLFMLVKRLYVREALNTRTSIPGDP